MDDRTSPPGPTLQRLTSGQQHPGRPRRAGARRFLIAAGVLLAAFGGYFTYANRPIVVEVAAPEENVPVRVFGLGTVEARIRPDIGFEVGATLAELVADEGDHVRKGDLLARLLPGEQEARLEKARAALLVSEAVAGK